MVPASSHPSKAAPKIKHTKHFFFLVNKHEKKQKIILFRLNGRGRKIQIKFRNIPALRISCRRWRIARKEKKKCFKFFFKFKTFYCISLRVPPGGLDGLNASGINCQSKNFELIFKLNASPTGGTWLKFISNLMKNRHVPVIRNVWFLKTLEINSCVGPFPSEIHR